MQTLRNRPSLRRGRVIYLKPDELAPNPVQPRKRFDEESLSELCESIKSYGILNPLTVRARNGGGKRGISRRTDDKAAEKPFRLPEKRKNKKGRKG